MISVINFLGYGCGILYLYFTWTYDAIELPIGIFIFSFAGLSLASWYFYKVKNSPELLQTLALPIMLLMFCIPQYINFSVSSEYAGNYIMTGKSKSWGRPTSGWSTDKENQSSTAWELQLESGESIWVVKGWGSEAILANLTLRKGVLGLWLAR